MSQRTSAIDGLEHQMSIIFTRLNNRGLSFPDSDIGRIRDLLTKMGRNSWSARPRTYSVLRMMGKEKELMDEFVKEKIFDICLPFDFNSLPLIVRGPTDRRNFLQKQAFVLTNADEMERGSHAHLATNADIHFEIVDELGRGGFGMVEEVVSNLSYNTYARKTILRKKGFGGSTSDEESFRNEFQNLKRLSHHHLVKYIGSYTDPQNFGILLLPVGECDLKEYLGKSSFTAKEFRSIRKFFGCITSGIKYLHDKSCRHKDIKPGNILIKQGVVYITDFGLAYDWTDKSKSKTEGLIGDRSVNYMAPEIAADQPRGSAADMWSLGCIFLDMLTVLKGETVEAKNDFFEKTGTYAKNPRQNEEAYRLWMEKLVSRHDTLPLQWTNELIVWKSDDRRTATELLRMIQRCNDKEDGYIYYCPKCDESVEESIPIPDLEGLNLGAVSKERGGDSMGNITIEDIRNGLIQAVTRDNSSDTRLWLKRWKSLIGTTEDCQTSLGLYTNALHIAARQGNFDIAQYLLKYGFDVNSIATGSTPLHLATKNGYEMVIRLLVDQGADMSIQDEQNGATALHIAAQSGSRSAAKFFVTKEAKVNAIDKLKCTPLHIAALLGHEEVAAVLLDHPNISANLHNIAGETPLHLAAVQGNERIVDLLLKHGVDIDTRDSATGSTALHRAAGSGKRDVIRLLIQRGAKANFCQISGQGATALHLAVASHQPQIVEELLEGEIDPDITDVGGSTALHLAVLFGKTEIVSLLLKKGFDINKHVKDPGRAVPLGIALHHGNTDIVKLLLENGANTNITGSQGETCLHGLALLPQGLEMVELLLEYNPDINVQDRNRNSPLMVAAISGNAPIIQKLLENGANYSTRDINYRTALHLAAHAGHVDAVDALLKCDVDINVEDQEKRTPLHMASLSGNVTVASMLLNAGAKIDAKDRDQRTPLWFAEDNRYADLVELLKGYKKSPRAPLWDWSQCVLN